MLHSFILATISLISFSSQAREMVLCVEVGHSRIKAALLPEHPTLEDLKKVDSVSVKSKPWLKENIVSLFVQSKENPINHLLKANPKKISLSVFGSEKNSKYPVGELDDLPENLHELLQKKTGCFITIERDTNSWAIGALEYLRLKSQQPIFPCLAITLGTGVGVVLMENEDTIKTIEFFTMPWPFPKMGSIIEEKMEAPVLVLCKKYLDSLFGGEEFLDKGMVAYRQKYNAHFRSFVEDISSHTFTLFKCPISSVLVGGGHSRFIDTSACAPLSLYLLNPQTLQTEGISPDIVQLLGCVKKVSSSHLSTYIYPSA